LLSNFASWLEADGKDEDAIFFLERNASDFPDLPSVHYELGQIYQRTERIEEAKKEYQLTLEIDPDHEGAREALSLIVESFLPFRSSVN
jgi:tetratricopeptide (TPR) repeat protein